MKYLIFNLLAISLMISSCGNKGDNDLGSIEKINAVLKQDPSDTAALYARAKYYVAAGKADSALTDMKQLTAIDSSRSGYFVTLADIYLMKNITRLTRQELEHAIKLDPDNKDAHMKLAELFLFVKMGQQSLDEINEVIKLEKHNPKAYFLKGMVYKESGDTALAISSFFTATEQDPNYASAYEQLGLIYAAKHDKRAIDFYQNALKANPKNSVVRYNMGYFFQQHGELEKAMTVYDELIQSDPSFANAHYNKGYILSEYLEKPSEAIPYFLEAARQNPRYAEAVYMVGLCNERLGNREQAITEYTASLKINPRFELSRNALSRLGAKEPG